MAQAQGSQGNDYHAVRKYIKLLSHNDKIVVSLLQILIVFCILAAGRSDTKVSRVPTG